MKKLLGSFSLLLALSFLTNCAPRDVENPDSFKAFSERREAERQLWSKGRENLPQGLAFHGVDRMNEALRLFHRATRPGDTLPECMHRLDLREEASFLSFELSVRACSEYFGEVRSRQHGSLLFEVHYSLDQEGQREHLEYLRVFSPRFSVHTTTGERGVFANTEEARQLTVALLDPEQLLYRFSYNVYTDVEYRHVDYQDRDVHRIRLFADGVMDPVDQRIERFPEISVELLFESNRQLPGTSSTRFYSVEVELGAQTEIEFPRSHCRRPLGQLQVLSQRGQSREVWELPLGQVIQQDFSLNEKVDKSGCRFVPDVNWGSLYLR